MGVPRASRRNLDLPEGLELPTSEEPQYVDENGFEVAAEIFAQALERAAGPPPVQAEAVKAEAGNSGSEWIGDAEMETEEVYEEQDENEEIVAEDEPEVREPLLSLADSNVLHCSLVTTRQRHLKQLLPHVFSHPAIPANNRPRARPPPRGTFLWPTPPPLVHPLPHREYHAPTQSSSTKAAASTPPVGDATPEPATGTNDLPGTIKRKYGRGKGKGKENTEGVEAPAHEIECLARITLSIGPISFPDTELWVGRFVQPRAAMPKPPKVPREKTERKRASVAEGSAAGSKRPRMKPGPVPRGPIVRPYPMAPGMAGPSNYRPPVRPGGAPGPPYPGQAGQPRPPPTRAELSPDLIRRVNEAATRNPWLSQIIHKAARTQATKEELAKLGRVVNRLKEGKDVGEGPDDPAPAPTQNTSGASATGPNSNGARPLPISASTPNPSAPPRPIAAVTPTPVSAPVTNRPTVSAPTNSNAPAAQTLAVSQQNTAMRRTASNSSGALTPPPDGGESDDDSDVDMSGPRQVGGGPGGIDPAATDGLEGSTSTPQAGTPAPPSQLSNPAQSIQKSPVVPSGVNLTNTTPSPAIASASRTSDSSSFSAPSQYRPPFPPTAPPMTQFRPSPSYPHPSVSQAYTSPSSVPQPPPPPRPTYPLPPPFLLVAFKEAPTEKFLLPLGSLSYMSRQGGDPEISLPLIKPPTPPVAPSVSSSAPDPTPVNALGPIKRTRASLGKNAKESTPESPKPLAIADPTPGDAAMPKKPEVPRSGLRSLPGSEPVNGTILMSTFVPAGEWLKPDWKALSESLPFNNPLFESNSRPASEVKVESATVLNATSGDSNASPNATRKRNASASTEPTHKTGASSELLPVRGKLLNLAAESFIPEDSEVHAVTIRLGDVTEAVWQRIKTISGMITTAELKSLGEQDPSLMPAYDAPKSTTVVKSEPTPPVEGTNNAMAPPPVAPATATPRPAFLPSAELRESYLVRKRNWFQKLLTLVPPRKFLRFRLSSPRPDITEATIDKWAPRPYPMSTKALYTREEEEVADEILLLSPELQPKRGNKKVPEPTVTFEMPVSLDQLDEKVAESAMSGKKLKGEDGRKRHGKRWVPGTICEGCGQAGKRVWRAGPGGKGTLCNSCGDKWTSGILGPLVAPSAANKVDEQNDAEAPIEKTGTPTENKATQPENDVESPKTGNSTTDSAKTEAIESTGIANPASKGDDAMDVDPPRSSQTAKTPPAAVSTSDQVDLGTDTTGASEGRETAIVPTVDTTEAQPAPSDIPAE